VLNAVAHKDYASSIPIQIKVYPDRLSIWNPGELPPTWTLEKFLGNHASVPFNPGVANVFFRSGMIEAWGRGIERIMAACREAGTPEPEVEFDPTGLWLTFHYLPEHRTPVEVPVKTRVEIPETRVEIPETRVEIPETRVEASVKTPDMILELLRTHPQMSLAQVAVAISKSLSAVERAVANLTEEKALRHIGPRKGGHWEVLK
jgi:ATP-dependent DNA helicase RecG